MYSSTSTIIQDSGETESIPLTLLRHPAILGEEDGHLPSFKGR